jgi:glycosyltransferase involved in cell wall biosynthesis
MSPPPAPHLCVLLPHLILGGGETAMMAVAEGLRERFRVSVCALDRRAMTVERSARGELVERFGEVAFVREPDELRAALAPADAVLWYGMNPFTPTVLEAMPVRPSSVRIVHTDKDEEGPLYEARWRHCIDASVCVSPAMQRRIPRSVFIPNTASPDRLAGERRHFFTEDRKTLGFLGRLFSFKNVPWLIDHVEALDCNLLIQGIDTEEMTRADLEERARRRGVAERVRFLEPGREVGTLLRSVDALAVVSRFEGFPMVAVEAGLLGVPVIARRVGALPEVFGEEIAFVEDGKEEGVPSVAALREVLGKVGPAMGRRLQSAVERLCGREAVVARYAAVLMEQMERRPSAGQRSQHLGRGQDPDGSESPQVQKV